LATSGLRDSSPNGPSRRRRGQPGADQRRNSRPVSPSSPNGTMSPTR
jgi:hypothetical protein